MADRTIFGLLNEFADPQPADGLESQRAGAGATYRLLISNLHKALTKASTAEAQAGLDAEKMMTAATTAAAIAALASQVADHGALGGLADDDHPQYLKDLIEDLTPQLGGDFDLADKITSGGGFKEVSETSKVTTHNSAGTFTPVLADGNDQIIKVSANITVGKPITTGIPGTGDRRTRMTLEFRVQSPGAFTMAFAGGFTADGNLPAFGTATGDVTVVVIEYDTDLADWRVVGDPILGIDNLGAITTDITPDFDSRTAGLMELMIQCDLNAAALDVNAPINGPGTDEFGRIYFAIQADGVNDITFNVIYDWGSAGQPDFSLLTNGKTSLVVAIKAGTKWLTNLVNNDHGAVF